VIGHAGILTDPSSFEGMGPGMLVGDRNPASSKGLNQWSPTALLNKMGCKAGLDLARSMALFCLGVIDLATNLIL
jgi:hypothetical protein